jgi:hypothetical protein
MEWVDRPRITSDGVTVWINGSEGAIARFGRMGIDIHTMDTTGCLFCTHEPTDQLHHWWLFQDKVREHYNIVVYDDHMPDRFKC